MSHCSVCDHTYVDAINAALLTGASLRQVGDRFDIGKSTLGRHVQHLEGVPGVSLAGPDGGAAPGLMGREGIDWPARLQAALDLWILTQASSDQATTLLALRALTSEWVLTLQALAARDGVTLAVPADVLPMPLTQRQRVAIATWQERQASALQLPEITGRG